jgi:nitric oxide dioxygenase
MLTQQQFALIEQSLPLLANAGVEVTKHFYARLFSANPEVKHYFNLSNQASGKQPLALFSAIARFATYLGEPEKLSALKTQIAHKHVALTILPEHYPIVGEHLLATLREMFPNEFTAEIESAWLAAYLQIADLLITEEAAYYQKQQVAEGGWQGTREFVISKIVQESSGVKSFYLMPADNKPIMDFTPGQYITVQVHPSDNPYRQMRHYSLTGKFANQYRITVKQDGAVSNYLHALQVGDSVNLTPPAGEFVLKNNPAEKVFISAGVGITPMIAMLAESIQQNAQCYFLHACQNQQHHSFKDWLNEQGQLDNVNYFTWYENGVGAEYNGFMQLSDISNLPLTNAEYYLCGPHSFMKAMYQQLMQLGVAKSAVHYELFGPHSDLSV